MIRLPGGMPLAQSPSWAGWWIAAVLVGIAALVVLVVVAKFFRLWLQAYLNNAAVPMAALVSMYLRKVEMTTIVVARIQLAKTGIHEITLNDLESHFLAGGRVAAVTRAMIAANRAVLGLDWRQACAIDLAGRDIGDAIHTSVTPRVIDVPDPTWDNPSIDAVAMDGIQLKVKVRVTVRTNLRQLVGGATEQTIIARVGEGIVSAIGSSITYSDVLENPSRISKAVLGNGLDAGTAYEILSIDIADLVVGDNIGAKLQVSQADADTRRFRAEAERRRAMAVARIAEKRAEVAQNRAKFVLAQADVPPAISAAFRQGNLSL